jgi:hypothetical protein
MIILFGTRSYIRTLAMLTLVCRNGHTAAHRLTERTRKFTLFFVPLFPISRKRYTICTACGETLQLDKAQADQLIAQQAQQAQEAAVPATGDPVAPPTSTLLPPDTAGS